MDRLALLIRAWDESESGTWSCYIGCLLGSIQHGIQAPNSTSLKCPRLTGSMSTRSSSLPTPTRRGMPPCVPGPVVWLPYPLILWPGFPISTSMWSRTLWCHVSPDRGRASTPPCVHGRVGRLLHLCPPTGVSFRAAMCPQTQGRLLHRTMSPNTWAGSSISILLQGWLLRRHVSSNLWAGCSAFVPLRGRLLYHHVSLNMWLAFVLPRVLRPVGWLLLLE
jgi:hypothetical protein